LNPEQQSLSGMMGEHMMTQFRVDKAFISIGGISMKRGVSDYDLGEAGMSRCMVKAANQTIVLTDDSKLNKEAFIEIVPIRQVHTIVSNVPPPREWQPILKSQHMQWIEAK
jgi:DeoR/GlpR family transcriptional regulator of sugar metabolism